jgi:hypothetical protein
MDYFLAALTGSAAPQNDDAVSIVNCASLIADEAMRIQAIAIANQKNSAVNLNKEK